MTIAYFEMLFEAVRGTPAAREFVVELTPTQRFALCVKRPDASAATVRELAQLGFTLGSLERLAGPPQPERRGRPGPEGEQAVWPGRCRSDQDTRKVPFCSSGQASSWALL